MPIRENLKRIMETIGEAAAKSGRSAGEVRLIAVTKLHTAFEINEAISLGVTDIAENRVQDIRAKYDSVAPVRWHLIGHLQTNKVKYIIDKVALIHSVDSLRLAKEIDRRAAGQGKLMDVLLQVNPARDESKFGVVPEELGALMDGVRGECPRLRVRGLMCVAPYTMDPEDARPYFAEMKRLFDGQEGLDLLSMGMSHDYRVAVEEGSNMVRIGTAIFGARDYRQEEK